MAKPGTRFEPVDQERANELTLGLLEALVAAIRDGRADVIDAEASNGFRSKPDSDPSVEELEYNGGGDLKLWVSVKPGLFWIDGHPFMKRGATPSE